MPTSSMSQRPITSFVDSRHGSFATKLWAFQEHFETQFVGYHVKLAMSHVGVDRCALLFLVLETNTDVGV
jgi:hypothetical protein